MNKLNSISTFLQKHKTALALVFSFTLISLSSAGTIYMLGKVDVRNTLDAVAQKFQDIHDIQSKKEQDKETEKVLGDSDKSTEDATKKKNNSLESSTNSTGKNISSNSEQLHSLFIATYDPQKNDTFSVIIYNAETNHVEREVTIHAIVPFHSYFSRQTVQINEFTSDVYYLISTNGSQQIYKTNLDQPDTSTMIFETTKEFSYWILNKHANTILFEVSDPNDSRDSIQKIQQIELTNSNPSRTIIERNNNPNSIGYLHQPVLSKDSTKLFQIRDKQNVNNRSHKMYLDTITLETGEIQTIEIFSGRLPDASVAPAISPDGTKVALWAFGDRASAQLLIRNIPSSETIVVPNIRAEKSDLGLAWSADGLHVVFALQDKIQDYYVPDHSIHTIREGIARDKQPLVLQISAWSQFILFREDLTDHVGITDLKSKKTISSLSSLPNIFKATQAAFVGLSWI